MDQDIREVLGAHGRLTVDVTDPGAVPDDADLYRAGLTSHATVNVMLALEDAFDVEFTNDLLRKSTFTSVASIRAALVQLGVEVAA